MSDAPERIWASYSNIFGAMWTGVKDEGADEYIRADLHAAAIARAERAEAALALAEEALAQAAPTLESAANEIADLENVLSSYRENWREAMAAFSVCRAALAKIAALKGGAE